MKDSKASSVGLIVGDLTNPFFAHLAQAVGGALRETGDSTLVVADAEEDPGLQVLLAKQLRAQGVSALVITIPHAKALLNQTNGPLVAVDRCDGVPYVTADNVLGGRLATQHLLKQGYDRPGLLYAGSELAPVSDRIQGYRHALRLAGHHPDPALEIDCGDISYEAAVEGATRLIDLEADAIFGVNDVLAVGAVEAAALAGRKVPVELGVVGYDDTPMASWPTVDLTSVAVNIRELGRVAATMALRLIKQPTLKLESTVLPPRLIARGSTARGR